MSRKTTVGEVIAAFLEQCGVLTSFGVISIHNLPILDAIGRRGKINYIAARGEAGALNMADGLARVTGKLGVAFTSTGTAAGNAAGAMIEALTAGSPILHITGQIETSYLDRDLAYIHEAPDQLSMLKSISKTAFRVRCIDTALSTVREAVRIALTIPTGPVSVEIPIDIQSALISWPMDLNPPMIVAPLVDLPRVKMLAEQLKKSRRPMLWLGGGARNASSSVQRLVKMGFGVTSSVQGRGIVPEDHPSTLGAYNGYRIVEDFYRTCDAMLVVGSRLRSNETLNYQLALPCPLYRIDADGQADNRGYRNSIFVQGDAELLLHALADELSNKMVIDNTFHLDLSKTREKVVAKLFDDLGPYASMVTTLQKALGRDFNWVRDITISNSIWGNRALQLFYSRVGVHALGGGIGQAIPMAIGASLGKIGKTVCLVGDGGLMVSIGELATVSQEKVNVLILLMNDHCYGVIRNIQDAKYEGRHLYVKLKTPEFKSFCTSFALPYRCLASPGEVEEAIDWGMKIQGPAVIEVDMQSFGKFHLKFIGSLDKERDLEI